MFIDDDISKLKFSILIETLLFLKSNFILRSTFVLASPSSGTTARAPFLSRFLKLCCFI